MTMSCICIDFEKQMVFRTRRLIRVCRVRCSRSIFCVLCLPCDTQKLHFQLELLPADLLTLANDMTELHAAAREFSKRFKHRIHDLCTHGPNAFLNTTPINSP
jgi:hypothetical protein